MSDVVDLAARPADRLEPDEIARLRAVLGAGPPVVTPAAAVPEPGWVPSVAAGQVIESAWGNAIRDRLTHRFATVVDRDGSWPAPPNGAQAITLDTFTTWLRRAGVWRVWHRPYTDVAAPVRSTGSGFTCTVDYARYAVAAGVVHYYGSVQVTAQGGAGTFEINLPVPTPTGSNRRAGVGGVQGPTPALNTHVYVAGDGVHARWQYPATYPSGTWTEIGSGVPTNWPIGTQLVWSITYETTS